MMTPIIMESDLQVVEKKIASLLEMEEKRLHLDVGDGLFCELLTVTPIDLERFEIEEFELDVHLMVDDPTEWIGECSEIGAERVIGQIERMGNQELFLEEVERAEMVGGLALMLETPIESLSEDALEKAEVVLLLAVPVGTSGSEFDRRVIKKIEELRKCYKGKILVDGGINEETEKLVLEAGADETGANSYYWQEVLNEEEG